MTNLPKPTVIIYDIDGTLLDTIKKLNGLANATRLQLGFSPENLAQTREFTGRPRDEALQARFGDRAAEAGKIFAAEVAKLYEGLKSTDEALRAKAQADLRATVIAGAEELLGAGAAICPQGVLSNKASDLLKLEMAALGWEKYFGYIAGAQDVPVAKPDKAAGDHVLQKLQLSSGVGGWFIGDADADMECAAALGMLGVRYVPQDEMAGMTPEKAKADVIINDLAVLAKFLQPNAPQPVINAAGVLTL